MKRRDLERHLKRHGCSLDREGANHSWWANSDGGRRSSVPRHREIKSNLVKAICKQLAIEVPRNVK